MNGYEYQIEQTELDIIRFTLNPFEDSVFDAECFDPGPEYERGSLWRINGEAEHFCFAAVEDSVANLLKQFMNVMNDKAFMNLLEEFRNMPFLTAAE